MFPKEWIVVRYFVTFASGFDKFSRGFERFARGFFSIFNTGFSKFRIELFCENPVVSILLSVKFCAEIGIRYRTKPRARIAAIVINRSFNNNITPLLYNRIVLVHKKSVRLFLLVSCLAGSSFASSFSQILLIWYLWQKISSFPKHRKVIFLFILLIANCLHNSNFFSSLHKSLQKNWKNTDRLIIPCFKLFNKCLEGDKSVNQKSKLSFLIPLG